MNDEERNKLASQCNSRALHYARVASCAQDLREAIKLMRKVRQFSKLASVFEQPITRLLEQEIPPVKLSSCYCGPNCKLGCYDSARQN